MIELSPERIAEGAGATIAAAGQGGRPERAVIDSREVGEGDLFFALQGERGQSVFIPDRLCGFFNIWS